MYGRALICHVNKFAHYAPLSFSLGVLLLDNLYFYMLASFMFKVTNNIAPEIICCICLRNCQIFMIIALNYIL